MGSSKFTEQWTLKKICPRLRNLAISGKAKLFLKSYTNLCLKQLLSMILINPKLKGLVL